MFNVIREIREEAKKSLLTNKQQWDKYAAGGKGYDDYVRAASGESAYWDGLLSEGKGVANNASVIGLIGTLTGAAVGTAIGGATILGPFSVLICATAGFVLAGKSITSMLKEFAETSYRLKEGTKMEVDALKMLAENHPDDPSLAKLGFSNWVSGLKSYVGKKIEERMEASKKGVEISRDMDRFVGSLKDSEELKEMRDFAVQEKAAAEAALEKALEDPMSSLEEIARLRKTAKMADAALEKYSEAEENSAEAEVLGRKAARMASRGIEGYESFLTKAGESITKFDESVREMGRNLTSAVGEYASEKKAKIGSLVERISEKVVEAKTFMSSLPGKLAESFVSASKSLFAKFRGGSDDLKAYLLSERAAVAKLAREAYERKAAAISESYESAKNTANEIGRGFKKVGSDALDGMDRAAAEMGRKATAFADKAESLAEKAADNLAAVGMTVKGAAGAIAEAHGENLRAIKDAKGKRDEIRKESLPNSREVGLHP